MDRVTQEMLAGILDSLVMIARATGSHQAVADNIKTVLASVEAGTPPRGDHVFMNVLQKALEGEAPPPGKAGADWFRGVIPGGRSDP